MGSHCFGKEESRAGRRGQLLGMRIRGGEPEGGVRLSRGFSAEEKEKSGVESPSSRRATLLGEGGRGDEKESP